MAKSLTETAKSILMKEGAIPSVSPMDAGHPDRGATQRTPNMATLAPMSRASEGRFANPGSMPPGGAEEAEDLGGQTPTSGMPSANFGAVASGKVGKDTTRSSVSAVKSEPFGSVVKSPTSEVMEEEFEISEELEAFVAEMVEQGLSEDEIAEAIEENFELVSEEEEKEDEDEKEDKKEKMDEAKETHRAAAERIKNKKKREKEADDASWKQHTKDQKDMKEHVDALLAGENLSEEFRAKAETIFESAVATRVEEEVQTLEEAYAAALEEQVAKIHEQLAEQVDDYLNYVVEQWVEQNEVAIETGLRTELTEEFISGLRNLFAEHYIDIPEDKVTVVESLGSKVETLESKLNEEIEKNVTLSKQLNESKKFEVLVSACDGLTDTQAAKLHALAENVEFTTHDEFARKVETLKESYFPSKVDSSKVLDLHEETDGKTIVAENVQGPMAAYVKALGKTLPK
jgi:hypothetical protein